VGKSTSHFPIFHTSSEHYAELNTNRSISTREENAMLSQLIKILEVATAVISAAKIVTQAVNAAKGN
jgi:hypothetical protein